MKAEKKACWGIKGTNKDEKGRRGEGEGHVLEVQLHTWQKMVLCNPV